MRPLPAGLIALSALQAATVPMDSARGDQVFQSQGCIQCHRLRGEGGSMCHGLTSSSNPNAKPVNQWRGLSDPVALVGAM